jgi:hypothetical protein
MENNCHATDTTITVYAINVTIIYREINADMKLASSLSLYNGES